MPRPQEILAVLNQEVVLPTPLLRETRSQGGQNSDG